MAMRREDIYQFVREDPLHHGLGGEAGGPVVHDNPPALLLSTQDVPL